MWHGALTHLGEVKEGVFGVVDRRLASCYLGLVIFAGEVNMDDQDYTRFRLNLPHFSVELAGEKTFVEELYRKVYRDLLPLMSTPEPSQQEIDPKPSEPDSYPRLDYTWIYSCSSHYNKVYVIENSVITHSFFGRCMDPRRLRRVYIDKQHEGTLFRDLSAGNRTLWAEITPEGRRMIEAAAKQRGDST